MGAIGLSSGDRVPEDVRIAHYTFDAHDILCEHAKERGLSFLKDGGELLGQLVDGLGFHCRGLCLIQRSWRERIKYYLTTSIVLLTSMDEGFSYQYIAAPKKACKYMGEVKKTTLSLNGIFLSVGSNSH